jgi:hypothetical protein
VITDLWQVKTLLAYPLLYNTVTETKINTRKEIDYEKVNSDIDSSFNRLSIKQILSLCFQKTNIGIYICCVFIFQVQQVDEN